MLNNPFTSDTFVSIWSKFFNSKKEILGFKTFRNLRFYKSDRLPVYVNIGKNITNGMSYEIDQQHTDYRGKVFLIHDIPTYFDLNSKLPKSFKLKKIKQYSGLLTTLDTYDSLDDILAKKFNAKRRAEFRKFKKRLETCFTISYETLFGNLSEEKYEAVMDKFYRLLSTRYDGKQTMNYNLTEHKWRYYKTLIYPMILNKQASIFVINNAEEPISIGVNFHSEDTMFYMMPAFDVNFSKFNLGHVSVMTMLNWGIENNFKHFDFSKGDAIYKRKWSDTDYNFEHHILYDSKSLKSATIGNSLSAYFKFKQYLRDKHVNAKLKDIAYKLKGKPKVTTTFKYTITESKDLQVNSNSMQLLSIYADGAKNYYVFSSDKQIKIEAN